MSATPIAVTIDLEVEHFDKAYATKLKGDLADFLGVPLSHIDVKPKTRTSISPISRESEASTKLAMLAKVGPTVEKGLQSFSGKVERVDGEVAHLTLKDEAGQEAFAAYDAAPLKAQGITEGTRFTCTIKRQNHETVVSFEPIAERELSDAEWNRLTKETSDALGDYEPKDDY